MQGVGEELRAKGHPVMWRSSYDRSLFGRGQIIQQVRLCLSLTAAARLPLSLAPFRHGQKSQLTRFVFLLHPSLVLFGCCLFLCRATLDCRSNHRIAMARSGVCLSPARILVVTDRRWPKCNTHPPPPPHTHTQQQRWMLVHCACFSLVKTAHTVPARKPYP